MPAPTITVELTLAELALLRDALDSHIYWELAPEEHRHSGHVYDRDREDPGTGLCADPDVEGIPEARALEAKLEALDPTVTSGH